MAVAVHARKDRIPTDVVIAQRGRAIVDRLRNAASALEGAIDRYIYYRGSELLEDELRAYYESVSDRGASSGRKP